MDFDTEVFIAWINAQYDAWCKGNPRRKKISAYAREVGVTSQVMSNWLLGKVKDRPSTISQQKLVDLYGPEAYSALGLPVPDVDPALADLPADLRDRYRAALLEIGTTLAKRSIDPESPEARQISTDILSKYELIISDN